jgi:hypothetical protein
MLATRFSANRRSITAKDGFLSEDDLRARVPSIFAEAPHESRSARYAYIPTIEIVRGLAAEGFNPTFACQALPRDPSRDGFTKHMLRFRRDDAGRSGEAHEIIGINSHGGETSFQLLAGIFRFVCCNGLVIGDRFEEIRVRHSGAIIDEVVEGAGRIVESFDLVANATETMKAIELKPAEQKVFAEAASRLRFDVDEGQPAPITVEQLLAPMRAEDRAGDLWTVFNRTQEHLIRGGLHGHTRDAQGRRRNFTSRPVQGIDGNVKLNRALWTLAERMAELKRAA